MSENNSIVFDTDLRNMTRDDLKVFATKMHSDVMLKPGTIVRHFKGKLYKVVDTATHTETAEELVVYQALYPPFATYARPKEMFLSKVDEEKYPEHAGEWRMRIATKEEIQGCDLDASRTVSEV